TAAGAELDLVVEGRRRERVGYEMKYSLSPTVTKGFWNALSDLMLRTAYVVYPGDESWPLSDSVEVLPAVRLGSGS
ncbi:MAG TPA: hypothetical protein VF202_07500, partial [Trueperaceae bacterium]